MKGLTYLHWSKRQTPVSSRFKAGAALFGLAWSLGVTFAACVLMSAWVVLSVGPVYNFSAFVMAGSAFGAVVGGAVCGRTAGSMGLIHGFFTGLTYGFLLAVLFHIGSSGGFNTTELLVRALVLGMAGALGGLLGVNTRVKKRLPVRERP